MRLHCILTFLLAAILAGCGVPSEDGQFDVGIRVCDVSHSDFPREQAGYFGIGALLATRFQSFDEFKSLVGLEYFSGPDNNNSLVRVRHCSHGLEIGSTLAAGLNQKDITNVESADLGGIVEFIFRSPYAIRSRADLQRIYVLSRRRPHTYGEGDPAFYDLAETMVANINTPDLAFQHPSDTTEKGYINTFNHLTAQAFISSMFSEKIADFVADVHERKNMPELISGKFSKTQLTDPENNPVDNYVDMINNEWGQELGKKLKVKYGLHRKTIWTPTLLANYLNDIQEYYGWALQIGFSPYRKEDRVVIRFSEKINIVMQSTF